MNDLAAHRAEQQLRDDAKPARAHDHLLAVQFLRALGDHIGSMANQDVFRIFDVELIQKLTGCPQCLLPLFKLIVAHGPVDDETCHKSTEIRLDIEQMNFQRLAISNEIDDMPNGA